MWTEGRADRLDVANNHFLQIFKSAKKFSIRFFKALKHLVLD